MNKIFLLAILLYVTGTSVVGSPSFPTTGGAYDETHNRGSDGFITIIDLPLIIPSFTEWAAILLRALIVSGGVWYVIRRFV